MIPDTLDLRAIPPQQGMDKHPCGLFPFQITNTHLQENKYKTGALLVVEFTTPAGRIEKRYNVINPSPQAVEIANKELSALGHAINIYSVAYPKNADGSPNMQMAGHTLRGGQGKLEVAFQKGHEPSAEKPSGGYVEVRKVFDVNGNEPGKAPAAGPSPQPSNGAAGWSAGPSAAPAPQGGGWANAATQQPAQPAANATNAPASGKPSWA